MGMRVHKCLLAVMLLGGVLGGIQVAISACDPVTVSVINHSSQGYLLSGNTESNGLSIQKGGNLQGQLEVGQYYGKKCGLLRLTNANDASDVRYAMVQPGAKNVSLIINADTSVDSTGLTEEGYHLKDYQEWYGVKKYLE